jgi:acetolactate synthase-1/2/3 large subunit
MNNAELIVEMLHEAGVERGFGIPSGNVLPFIEAMRRGGIDFVLTAHEGSAGFAADVTGRQTGAPGLCIATLGPGATNLATGVGSAFLDRSPMIAITCNLDAGLLGRRLQMAIDHHALFAPITKASLAARPDNVAQVTAEAIRIAMAEPRGPVHIDLPEDVALAPAMGRGGPASEAADPAAGPAANPAHAAGDARLRLAAAAEAEIEAAARVIASARRPIAVIGANALRMADPGRLRVLVERLGMPFATTTMAKGMIDEDHPLAIGCIERACRQALRRFIAGGDLVIGLGYDTVEVEYEAWVGKIPVFSIDIEPPDVATSVSLAGTVVGDLDDALERLTGRLEVERRRGRPDRSVGAWDPGEIAAHRGAFQALLRPAGPGFQPHQLIDVCREVLPANGILAFDVGAHTHQIASQWTAHEPRTFLITNGWSSMGFGLPAAIAAALADPDRPVLCLIGDGCFQMTCGELAAARRAGITLPVVVIDDGWLSLISVKQARRGYPPHGSALEPVRGPGAEPRPVAGPSAPARRPPPSHYFGVPAMGVASPAELRVALTRAFRATGPTVIEAAVDGSHYLETVFD